MKVLLAGVLTAFCCSIGNAQFTYSNVLTLTGATLIYSNSFNGSAVSVDGTAPTVRNNVLGGTNTATWNCVSNNPGAGAVLNQDGTVGLLGDSYLLPFVPQSNYVYVLTTSANLPSMASGKWLSWGFAQFATNRSTGPRFADSAVNGYDFMIGTCVAGSEQFWAGPRATGYGVTGQLMPSAGNHVLQIILDTTAHNWTGTTNWVGAGFVDGQQLGTNWIFTSLPLIGATGLGQTTLSSSSGIQYVYFTLTATPMVLGRQPVSAAVAAGSAFTNTVVVAAAAPAYQWYTNNVPIPGATNASLILNPVTVANAGTNYYVVVTNSLGGAVTSAPVSLTVYSAPTIAAAYPVTYTNPATLYGATNISGTNYSGSSPTFSVSVIGQAPLFYQWRTNGVAVGGATGAGFTFTNCPLNGPTNFACVVTNIGGAVTNTWLTSYVPSPTAPFASLVMANNPLGFWRLNEGPDDGNGDNGVIALDYAGGNDGMYSNAILANATSYSPGTDPAETSPLFSSFASPDSDVFGIQGIDFSNSPSATFSVEAWVNGVATQTGGAGIVAKGYNGGEQFALDVSGNKYRFVVRNAAGTVSSVTAGTGPDNNWHFVVGVCDETNGMVSLYVDGLLAAASASIAPGSGIFPCATPITIGARGSSATANNDLQFKGYVDDVAVFKSALSAGQIASLYAAAGYTVGFTFVPPLPPTNFVFQANTTVTIPATVFSTPPIGYYWTNLTAGGIVGSGLTNVLGNLNATLIISNAPASLSGDQLELVVTNATVSTNWLVSLFSPPPPVTLDYSEPDLYSNSFYGGTWSIAGQPLTAANSLLGGTNITWTDVLGTNDTGSMQASGIDACPLGDSWVLPFTPHSGYVYTLTASVTFNGNAGNWVGLGFAQRVATNAANGFGRFSDGGTTPPQQGPNGYAWEILTESSGNVQDFGGAGGQNQLISQNGFFTAGTGTHTAQVILDATGAQWVMSAFVDGAEAGTGFTYTTRPPIGAVGITQNSLGTPGFVQWNSFDLSQVAPGGVPPYLLDPQPSTNSVLLTNATVTIPATAFGSGPLGYYWSNNSTIIASGSTNAMAPLPATLTIPSTSLSAGQLSLVVTNAYGTNTTLITLVSAVNPNPGPIQFYLTGNQLTLGWPTNLGWTLQVQTNNLNVGLGTNWLNVPGSTTVTNVVIPIDPINGSVFYRLHL